MSTATVNALKDIKSLAALDGAALEKIAPLFIRHSYSSGRTIIAHDERSNDVFFIVSGKVRATIFTPGGKEISYQDLGPGDMFGEMSAIDQRPRSTHVLAREATVVMTLTGKDFNQLLDDYPAFARATLKRMTSLVRFLCDRVYEYSALGVGGRIRAELVRLVQQSVDNDDVEMTQRDTSVGQEIVINPMPKHQELANRLATHREAVTRELNQLEKAGIIKKQKGALVILDFDRLKIS